MVACDADRPVLRAPRGAGHRPHRGPALGDQRDGPRHRCCRCSWSRSTRWSRRARSRRRRRRGVNERLRSGARSPEAAGGRARQGRRARPAARRAGPGSVRLHRRRQTSRRRRRPACPSSASPPRRRVPRLPLRAARRSRFPRRLPSSPRSPPPPRRMASPAPRDRKAAIRCVPPIRPPRVGSASRARRCCACTCLADGRIGDVAVEHSAGHPDLDQAAMEAVRRWRFEPARRGADAVAMWVLLPVEFRLTR